MLGTRTVVNLSIIINNKSWLITVNYVFVSNGNVCQRNTDQIILICINYRI